MKIALVVGHSRFIGGRRDGGAVSATGVQEWTHHSKVAALLASKLEKRGARVLVISDIPKDRTSYGSAMRWAAQEIEDFDADYAFDMHFNAANGKAAGHEWLYWHSSKSGKEAAKRIESVWGARHPDQPARGVKAVESTSENGGGFLYSTHCPAVLFEPAFGDNPDDWARIEDAEQYANDLSDAIADAVGLGSAPPVTVPPVTTPTPHEWVGKVIAVTELESGEIEVKLIVKKSIT